MMRQSIQQALLVLLDVILHRQLLVFVFTQVGCLPDADDHHCGKALELLDQKENADAAERKILSQCQPDSPVGLQRRRSI